MNITPISPQDLADHMLHIHKGDHRKAYAECLGYAKQNAGTATGVIDGQACALIQKAARKAGVEI